MKYAIFSLSTDVFSDASSSGRSPQKIVDRFFDRIRLKALILLSTIFFRQTNGLGESIDQVDNVKFKINSTLKLLGKYEGFDLVSKSQLPGI